MTTASADLSTHTVLCICVQISWHEHSHCVWIYVLISWHENTVFIFVFCWTNLLYVSWTHCMCLCYLLTWAHCVFVFWSTNYCVGHRNTVLCACVLINRPAICVMNMLYLCSYRLTCCMCHRKSLFLCSNHLTCCVGHQHTVLSICILINWPAVWVRSRLCCVFFSSDLIYGSRKHCVCVQINWPAVWVMNTQCCVSLSTDRVCGSWTQCVVCPYQLTCCVGHEHGVLCFFSADR